MRIIPFVDRVRAVRSLCEGTGIRGTGRILGLNRDTVMAIGRDVGEGYARLHDVLLRNLRCESIEVDEAWSFVGKKQKRVRLGDPPAFGDQYVYLAIDADRKAIVSYLVGKRNGESTVSFALDLRSRLAMTPQITTDGWAPYVQAIAIAFGKKVDYAMLIKYYNADCSVETARRYSPNNITRQEVRIIYGDPDLDRISTSYIERQNLTLRSLVRRFTRLTNGTSKVLRNHLAAVDLYVGWYNLVRVHETLGMTPAMAVGAADHAWNAEEFVDTCLMYGNPKHPPVRHGSQRFAKVVCEDGLCRESA